MPAVIYRRPPDKLCASADVALKCTPLGSFLAKRPEKRYDSPFGCRGCRHSSPCQPIPAAVQTNCRATISPAGLTLALAAQRRIVFQKRRHTKKNADHFVTICGRDYRIVPSIGGQEFERSKSKP